nr:unnamed protein product [Digitaria exilis]
MDSPRGPASFATQANALLRKNLCVQKRNLKTNIGITFFPILICVLLIVLQNVINSELDKPKYKCGCSCLETSVDGRCVRKECGIQYSSLDQVGSCPIPNPPRWPALIQVPRADFRAIRRSSQPFDDLPDPLCRDSWSCPATVLVTGKDKAVAGAISRGLFPSLSPSLNATDFLDILSNVVAVSNAYLKFVKGAWVEMLLEYVKDMPKVGTSFQLDLSSLLSALFFTWIIELLFPVSMMRCIDVILTYLVYEKQEKLKIMMKMHGLKDGPYWLISYSYFLALSVVYMLFFVIFGSLIVVGYMYVFGSGLLGAFLFRFFVEDKTFPYGWILVMEIVPGFSLYRGLYELGQYAFSGSSMGATGMTWRSMKDPLNGMRDVLIIMTLEWALLLILAFYLDQASLLGDGVRKKPFFCFRCLQKKHAPSLHEPSFSQQDSRVILDMEKSDVALERKVVEQLLIDRNANQAIVCDKLRKVYPGRDGNPDKLAVRGLSLVLQKGQCFGLLGPNGAGKTSFINMMIGLIRPTSGTAYVHGMDINTDMGNIYTNMGVCPQHNLLWETLTGKEHLFFYGRLKNLKGAALVKAVDHSLKSVNLAHGNVGDKQVKAYSGGMKRRLSVAISLIGDPKVVFMDEPSTGLDPASRNNLWNVVKEAKRNRAIILTSNDLSSANKIYHLSGTQKFELPKQEVKIAHVFAAVENAKRRLNIHAWGLVDTTLEDVFIKVARGAQAFNEFA